MLFWRKGIDVTVRSMCRLHIDAEVEEDGFNWRVTGVYGEAKAEEKEKT